MEYLDVERIMSKSETSRNFKLTSTDKEKAKQLIEASKKKKFTAEELKELVPVNPEFVKEFCTLLKDVEADARESHKECIDSINNCIQVCRVIVANDKLTGEEKLQVIPVIKDATDAVNKMHKRKCVENLAKFLGVLAAIVVVVGPLVRTKKSE